MIRLTSDFAQFTKRAFSRSLSFALLASVSILSAETLESSNPFLPPDYSDKKEAPKPVVQFNGPISREIEFRGLFKVNGQYQFSLFNKRDQKSHWLKENEAAAQGISVRNYDSGSRSLTVNMSGRTERITLMTANSTPLAVVTSVSQPVNTNGNAKQPALPPVLQNITKANNNSTRKAVPRRRVILPKK
jgi:VCBS repeat-containing protein